MKKVSNGIKFYLTLYNLISAVLWGVVLYKAQLPVINSLLANKEFSYVKLISSVKCFDNCWRILAITQTLAGLEIFHSLFGWVRAPVATTISQVFSRYFLVWGILFLNIKHNNDTFWFFCMVTAWSITEIIRYSFYALTLTSSDGKAPYILTWLRYSTFIVLYPLGVSGELGVIYNSIPTLGADKVFSIKMPNTLNWAFDYSISLYLTFIVWPIGLYGLYTYMFKQRRKVLGSFSKVKKN